MLIYLLTSPSGKHYVGQTIQTLDERWRTHVSHAMTQGHDWPLHRAIRKHGPDGWTQRVIWRCSSVEEMDLWEAHFIDLLGDYNASTGGDRPVFSEESRAKMSAAAKGRPKSEAHRQAIAEACRRGGRMARTGARKRGHTLSEEHRRKISEAGMGRVQSEETKRKRSESIRRWHAERRAARRA